MSHLSWSLPGGQVLLDDVSFRVGEGEHVALVGANGAGKSTIMRLVAGMEKATGAAKYTYDVNLPGDIQFAGVVFAVPDFFQ